MVAEVFFAAVTQPDSQYLWDGFFLGFTEGLVEGHGATAFCATGHVIVGVPIAAGQSDTAANFLN